MYNITIVLLSWSFEQLFDWFIIALTDYFCFNGLCAVCHLKEIGSLKKLTQLDLSENKIERLPASIGQLASLRDLYLSDNQIDYLPDTFGLCIFAAVSCLQQV